MNIDATTPTAISVNAQNVRYSLLLDSMGSGFTGSLIAQRSQHNADGTWLDDPSVGSRAMVPLPTSSAAAAAYQSLAALLPALLGKLGHSVATVDRFRIRVFGELQVGGVLDVRLTIQAWCGGSTVGSIPSLNAFLTNQANADIAPQIVAVWNALDAAINADNAERRWL